MHVFVFQGGVWGLGGGTSCAKFVIIVKYVFSLLWLKKVERKTLKITKCILENWLIKGTDGQITFTCIKSWQLEKRARGKPGKRSCITCICASTDKFWLGWRLDSMLADVWHEDVNLIKWNLSKHAVFVVLHMYALFTYFHSLLLHNRKKLLARVFTFLQSVSENCLL